MSSDGKTNGATNGRYDVPRPEGKPSLRSYASGQKSTWCPGCGDFGILAALKQAFVQLELWPHEVFVVGGIGCGSKLPDYMTANGFMTIHGRPLPVATGVKLANPKLKVVVTDGDGDAYGIGGNHFLHTCRRNIDITHIVENNQIYALTKGQYSPTSEKGFRTTTSPEGAIESPVKPLLVALAAGATFIARHFAGEPKALANLIAQAIQHRGYALIDVLQPCVTFNKINTYEWYEERIYKAEESPGYDPADKRQAWELVSEWGERIPIGILYQDKTQPAYEEMVPGLERGPIVDRDLDDLSVETFEQLKLAYV